MDTKFCTKCNLYMEINQFEKGRAQCKTCRKLINQKWRRNNKNHINKYNQNKWKKLKNDINYLKKRKEWYALNKEKILQYKKQYYLNNKEFILKKHSQYENFKYKTDPLFRLRKNIRRRILAAFKGFYKNKTTQNLIGCSWLELKLHIEKQFKKNMCWENYGEWHIDHIKPLSLFNILNEDELKKANHYTNLQPLWAFENLSKGNKFR